MKALFLFVLLVAANAQASIKIVSAVWGGRIATLKAAAFCDGHETCSYKISSKYIDAPTNTAAAQFNIKWTCGVPGKVGTVTIASSAEGKVIEVSCPIPATELVGYKPPALAPIPVLPDPVKWTQYLIAKQPVSLHAMIANPSPDKVEEKIGDDCAKAIRTYLRSGKTFRSNLMLQKYTRPLSKFAQAETQSGDFYHYTNAREVSSAVQAKDLNPIFSFLRSQLIGDNENRWFWYVATDSESSSSYGAIRINVHFDKQALVFVGGVEKPDGTNTNQQVNDEIQAEMVKRDPRLSACLGKADTEGDHGYYSNSIMTYLAAEASGIKLVAYYGELNQMVPDDSFHGHQWLQVIGPWAVKSADVN